MREGCAHLSHGVSDLSVGDLRRRRAVSRIGSYDLSGVGDIVPGIRAGHEGSGSSDDR